MGLIQGSEGLRTTMGPAATDPNGFSTEVSLILFRGGIHFSNQANASNATMQEVTDKPRAF